MARLEVIDLNYMLYNKHNFQLEIASLGLHGI